MDVDVIESDAEYRDEKDHEDQEDRDPEVRGAEGHAENAGVLAGDEVRVDEESQWEEESHAAEGCYVVEDSPVGGVKGNLRKRN